MGPRTPLDDVEFLAGSANRVEVLRLLAVQPWTRRELHDETGIPQPTLGRILDGFDRRGWPARSDDRYRLSRPGALLADEFDDLLATVESIQTLAALDVDLSAEDVDLDPRLLRDAT